MYRLFIYHRHSTKAATITNEAHGDDTYELAGTAEDLRRYAECGIEAQTTKPQGPDRTYHEGVYQNILDVLDGDLSPYEATSPVPWRDLVVYRDTAVTLGAMVDSKDAGLAVLLLSDDGAIDTWPGHLVAGPSEEPEWDTPKVPVDWAGFREALAEVTKTSYAATVYTTTYHGEPYGEGGEAGPDTDNPRQLAEGTLHAPGQYLIATAPDGSRTQFKYSGQSRTRVEEIELPD